MSDRYDSESICAAKIMHPHGRELTCRLTHRHLERGIVMHRSSIEMEGKARIMKWTDEEAEFHAAQKTGRSTVTEASGWMRCTSHPDLQWCDHMEAYVKEHRDASQLQHEPVAVVPLFPVQGLWVEVDLGVANQFGFRTPRLTGHTGVEIELDALTPSEGRLVLRSMVISWIKNHIPTQCSSRTHKPSIKMDIHDRVSLFTTGYCRGCSKFADFSADVPELGDARG